MALKIMASCVNCTACESLCPSGAIRRARSHYVIESEKCTECQGAYEEAQCAAICPIEGAIVDSSGVALNPPGSLTGIPPDRWAAVQAEIALR